MKEVINQYQLTFDRIKLKSDTYTRCLEDSVCGEIINTSSSDILQWYYAKAYDNINAASNDIQWQQAHLEAQAIESISKNKNSAEYNEFIKNYFLKDISTRVTYVEMQIEKMTWQL
jgi:hypothetical protein